LPESLRSHNPSPPQASKAGETISIHKSGEHSKKDKEKAKKRISSLKRYGYVSIIVDLQSI
jgi:hypothetical protein